MPVAITSLFFRTLLAILVIFLFVAIPILNIYGPIKNRQAYKRLRQLSNYFTGSKIKYYLFESWLKGKYQGYDFLLRYYIANDGSFFNRSYFHNVSISLYFQSHSKMKIIVYNFRGLITTLGKALFLKKVDTGHQDLDKLTIYSNLTLESRLFFHDEKRHFAFQYFLRSGWFTGLEPLKIGKKKISVHKIIQEFELNHTFIKEALYNMIALKNPGTI